MINLWCLFQCLSCDLQESSLIRALLITVTVLFIHAVAQVNVVSSYIDLKFIVEYEMTLLEFLSYIIYKYMVNLYAEWYDFQLCCKGGVIFGSYTNRSAETIISFNRNYHLKCEMPQYIYLSGLISCLATAVFLKFSSFAKLLLMLLVSTGYVVVMEYTHKPIFGDIDKRLRWVPTHRHNSPIYYSHCSVYCYNVTPDVPFFTLQLRGSDRCYRDHRPLVFHRCPVFTKPWTRVAPSARFPMDVSGTQT